VGKREKIGEEFNAEFAESAEDAEKRRGKIGRFAVLDRKS
jgi:hypothetical protein